MMSDWPDALSRLPACPSGLPLRIRPSRKLAFRVLPGTAESVAAARRLAAELLGDGHPAIDTALLLMSELVTNSVKHSRSRLPGGTLTVVVCTASDGILIQVRDDGGPAKPRLLAPARASAVPAEHGYGLLLVSALAHTWGTMTTSAGRVTWCRVKSE